MTQTPSPVRTGTGLATHWTLEGQTTLCGKVASPDTTSPLLAEILEGRRDPSCRMCNRHTPSMRRALAR